MSGQRIGIIGAMESEVSHLKNAMDNVKIIRFLDMDFYSGGIGTREVVVVKSGIAKVNAAICTTLLITRFGVTSVINTGVAGSLDPRLEIGDFVVSTKAAHHDMDVTPLGYAVGQVPGMDLREFPCDASLRKLAVDVIAKTVPEANVFEGPVVSGEQFVGSAEQKDRILEHFDAMCCEMEGSAIAQTCYLAGIPCLIVRVMSDNADGSSPEDYHAFEERMSQRSARVVEELVKVIA